MSHYIKDYFGVDNPEYADEYLEMATHYDNLSTYTSKLSNALRSANKYVVLILEEAGLLYDIGEIDEDEEETLSDMRSAMDELDKIMIEEIPTLSIDAKAFASLAKQLRQWGG